MTITKSEILGDLRLLSPEEKIEFMLNLAEQLIPVLRNLIGETEPFLEIFKSYGKVISTGRLWLDGKVIDPDAVIAPVERPSGRPFDSLELDYKDTEHFGNLRVVGSMITDAILYAGQIQFQRVGDANVPQSLEEEYTDGGLADEFERTLSRASPALVHKFEEFWVAAHNANRANL